jgi:DNA (cytosine-5)-methyltransferase 1
MGTLTHGSLFSGIGGFDLAAEWMGWENKFHCEWNEFGQRVLNYYWPNAELFKDITKSDFKKYYGTVDVISGGFPCQPYSNAGKRLGKEDERHLWPEMLRVIKEVAPRYVVGENVRGLTNWNGGMVFEEVCIDLENLGYSVAPFIIPASAVNAPHKRERIWFVAYSERFRLEYTEETRNFQESSRKTQSERGEFTKPLKTNGINGNATNADSSAYEKQHSPAEPIKQKPRSGVFNERGNFERFPTQSPICGGNDGLPTELDGVAFSKWRNESIKAYGNAVVPQVVFEIFKAIEKYESL